MCQIKKKIKIWLWWSMWDVKKILVLKNIKNCLVGINFDLPVLWKFETSVF